MIGFQNDPCVNFPQWWLKLFVLIKHIGPYGDVVDFPRFSPNLTHKTKTGEISSHNGDHPSKIDSFFGWLYPRIFRALNFETAPIWVRCQDLFDRPRFDGKNIKKPCWGRGGQSDVSNKKAIEIPCWYGSMWDNGPNLHATVSAVHLRSMKLIDFPTILTSKL